MNKFTLPNPLIVFDVETTGVDPRKHDIIEIGAVFVSKGLDIVGRFQSYCRPYSTERDPEAMGINKIPEETLLEAPGFDACALAFEHVAKQVAESHHHGLRSFNLAGWGVRFDYDFIGCSYQKAERAFPFSYHTLDIKSLAIWELAKRGCYLWRKLSGALSALKIQPVGTAHTALADAENTARILIELGSQAHFIPGGY